MLSGTTFRTIPEFESQNKGNWFATPPLRKLSAKLGWPWRGLASCLQVGSALVDPARGNPGNLVAEKLWYGSASLSR